MDQLDAGKCPTWCLKEKVSQAITPRKRCLLHLESELSLHKQSSGNYPQVFANLWVCQTCETGDLVSRNTNLELKLKRPGCLKQAPLDEIKMNLPDNLGPLPFSAPSTSWLLTCKAAGCPHKRSLGDFQLCVLRLALMCLCLKHPIAKTGSEKWGNARKSRK